MVVKQTINQIFQRNKTAYLKRYPKTSKFERKIIQALVDCRTEKLGFRIYRCNNCKNEEVLYNSCRNRHCPQCQNLKKEKWIADRQKEVLPFTYFHLVFTIPDGLNPIAYRNKRIIYKLLFDCVKQTLLSVASDEKYFGAEIGFFSILHTWGQKLNLHPHLHCVVPGGGFSKKKGKWIQAPKNYLVPVEVLKKRFRSLFLVSLKKLFAEGLLYLKGTNYQDPAQFQKLIDKHFVKDWVVYIKESFQNSSSVIKYLGRYTHKIAITNHRIISVDNGMVNFKYRDYTDGNKEKTLSLDTVSFMRRFMLHILPYRFVRIRYYGLLAHCNKRKSIEACRKFYNIETQTETSKDGTESSWQEVLYKLTGHDFTKCKKCKIGHMVLLEDYFHKKERAPP